MYKASVNQHVFDITSDDGAFQVNGQPLNWDLVKISDGRFHIQLDNKGYNAEVVAVEKETKSFQFKINGRLYKVALKDKFDLLLEQMGMNGAVGSKINNVKAPMPGLIIDLRVKEGDPVKAGDPLLILEAMKMENIIKAAGDSVVKSVKVKKGESVEKNQVLIEF
jgi:biotin carboxyl carrier protein